MSDNVILLVDGKQIENFISYKVTSNLFEAADPFSLELANPEIEIIPGKQCQLYVNGVLELTGIIDKITENYSKRDKNLTVEGRDLMGIVVDAYVENDFKTLENTSLQQLAEWLLPTLPFISKEQIIYGKGNKERAVPVNPKEGIFSATKDFIQVEPGDTVFETLKKYALADGLLFFCLADGTIIFGEPLTSGSAGYTLINKKSGIDNNILEGTRTRDISQRYSKVVVMGQMQESVLGGNTQQLAYVQDDSFPFPKTYVAVSENVSSEPLNQARLIMNKQKFEGLNLEYRMKGHSQGKKNYQTNTIIHVIDEDLSPKVDNDYLIYARTYERSKTGGTTTVLRLSELGVLPA